MGATTIRVDHLGQSRMRWLEAERPAERATELAGRQAQGQTFPGHREKTNVRWPHEVCRHPIAPNLSAEQLHFSPSSWRASTLGGLHQRWQMPLDLRCEIGDLCPGQIAEELLNAHRR